MHLYVIFMKKKEINGGIVMKCFKRLTACIIATALCVSSSGTIFALSDNDKKDISEKFSDYLLEKYEVTRSEIAAGRNSLPDTDKIPVLVWCRDDIDHDEAVREALPVLVNDLKETAGLRNLAVTSETTLNDVMSLGAEPTAEAIQEYIETERDVSCRMYSELNGEFAKKYMSDMEVTYISKYSPVVVANLSLNETVELAEKDVTVEFAYYGARPGRLEALDVSTVVTGGQLVHNSLGYTGEGVKIGELDGDVPDIVYKAQLTPVFNNVHINLDGFHQAGNHGTGVACILIGQQTNNYTAGMAPDAELYATSIFKYNAYTDEYDPHYLEQTEWLLSNGANVINVSYVFGEDGDCTYGSYAKWLDHIAVNHYVTLVQSSGNFQSSVSDGANKVISGAMAYNIITVGNIDDKNTVNLSDDELCSSSAYSASNTLAYKPDICAPGTGIVNEAYPNGMTGTSASAPHVTGTVALMFEAKPTLKLYPEVVKAILTAAVNPDSDHRYWVSDWTSNTAVDSYAKYGAGLLDAYHATQAAYNVNYEYGVLSSTNNQVTYNLNVPSTGLTVRVSLAFHKYNAINNSHTSLSNVVEHDLQDLDLRIIAPDNTVIRTSLSSNNSVENIEFGAMQTGNYTIVVNKVPNSYTGNVEYGLAWMEAY